MKPIDSVLKILVQRGGTELRLASDRRPQMFKEDAELPLTIPAMSTERIRALLDDLWTSHAAALRQQGHVSFTYSSAELGTFVLMLAQPDESTLEVRLGARHGCGGCGFRSLRRGGLSSIILERRLYAHTDRGSHPRP